MGKLLIALVLVCIVVGIGTVALASWNIPAPTARIEKALPDEAFPR